MVIRSSSRRVVGSSGRLVVIYYTKIGSDIDQYRLGQGIDISGSVVRMPMQIFCLFRLND
jgi:hypothetical protein